MKADILNPFLDDALLCRAADPHDLGGTPEGVIMWMPGGVQILTPMAGGIGTPITVLVDASTAVAAERQRVALTAKGKDPYFDFEHNDDGASFWPKEFFWSTTPKPAVYARGDWSKDGDEGVKGKRWKKFSPVFHVDNKRAVPARVVCNEGAMPNMGGICNNAAFHNISPLWAKNASGAQSTTPTNTTMTPEELAALQAKNKELTAEVDRLKGEQTAIKAKNENDELVSARIAAKESELKANAAAIENGELKAKNTKHEADIKARNATDAKVAVSDAVSRGVIAAKDADTIKAWEDDITENPSRAALLAKMPGNAAIAAGRITPPANGGARVIAEAPNAVIKEYIALVAKNSKLPLSAETAKEKAELARDAAAVFAKDISKNDVLQSMDMDQAIKASDNTDANVGLLSGSLTLQRSLPQMKYIFPLLSSISTDFSAEPGVYNQTANTRVVLSLPVEDYDATLDANNRPKGFVNAIPGQAIDVPVTLNSYFGVPVVFGITQIAATVRDLFGEQAPMASYAIGTKLMSMLTVLMTAGNFNAYKGISDAAGATTNGSTTVVVTDSTLNYPGQFISGAGIPANAFVKSITDATHIVISKQATATAAGVALTFGTGKVPNTYTTYAKALANFNGASLGDIRAALTMNDIPSMKRFAALNPNYYKRLGEDPALNSFFAAMQSPEIITEGKLPRVQGFAPIEAPWMPSDNNVVGFAGHEAALVLKTRLPQDLSRLGAGPLPGSVTTITDPETGISILLVQRVDLTGNYAEYRPELMAGSAVGERRAGLVMTSV